MKYIALAILVVFSTINSIAMAGTVSGTVTLLRAHTNEHDTVSVRQYTAFQVSIPLESPCTWLYISPEDKSTLSFLLAARASASPVTIHYHTTVSAPWHSGSCAVYAVDL